MLYCDAVHRPRLGFSAVLVIAMAGSTFALAIISVLAADLIREFGISREQLGIFVTGSALTGALLAPVLGPWADHIGARTATMFTLIVSAVSLTVIGLAPTYAFLLVGALLTGVTQGISNPATNKLISVYVDRGRRGIMMGVKQSGVQFGNAIGGFALPPIALAAGWRFGVTAAAAIPIVGVMLALWAIPASSAEPSRGGARRWGAPAAVWRLAAYGLLLGLGGGAVFTYLPLFAQESLGMDPVVAGSTVAVVGVVGVIARIGWGRVAEQAIGSDRSLLIIAVLSVLLGVSLTVAQNVGAWVLWPIAVLAGLSAAAWNPVAMLAVIDRVPFEQAGSASGVVMFGFLGGLGLGAPAFGRSVDVLGDYRPGWITVTVAFSLASLLWVGPARRSSVDA